MDKFYIRKFDFFKTRYWEGADISPYTGVPILKRNHFIPHDVISFNEKYITHRDKHWLDHFIDDYNFECMWNCLERYLPIYNQFAGVIGPDFSLYQELLPPQCKWNVARNRIIDYRLQSLDIPEIPVASWQTKDSLSWSLDGLPDNSSIAVTTNGCQDNPYSFDTFLYGVNILQAAKTPYKLIICGPHIKELDKYDNVIYYPNYSMRRKERES